MRLGYVGFPRTSRRRAPLQTSRTEPAGDKTVVIIDDHQTFAEALRVVIDREDGFACVDVANTLAGGMHAVEERTPDIVLIDVFLPDGDGIDGVRRIRAKNRGAHVVVMTGQPRSDVLAAAASAGASGFVPKDRPLEVLLGTLRTLSDGGLVLEPATLSTVLARRAATSNLESLTGRETEILHLMGEGLDPQTIARRLHISAHTSRGHVKRILAKLGAHSQLEAVVIAARRGLLRFWD